MGLAPPLEFPLPHPREIMGGGTADLGVGKKNGRLRLRGMKQSLYRRRRRLFVEVQYGFDN